MLRSCLGYDCLSYSWKLGILFDYKHDAKVYGKLSAIWCKTNRMDVGDSIPSPNRHCSWGYMVFRFFTSKFIFYRGHKIRAITLRLKIKLEQIWIQKSLHSKIICVIGDDISSDFPTYIKSKWMQLQNNNCISNTQSVFLCI